MSTKPDEKLASEFTQAEFLDIRKKPLDIFPSSAHPYLELIRLEKPTGTKLMFWPFAWGLTMAAHSVKMPWSTYSFKLMQCFLSAFIIRSSACTINDIFDRKMDVGVERTKNRPLPSGRITVFAASFFVLVQYAIGIAWFYVTVEDLALCVALVQLLPIFAIYPLLKRVTYWPQAWLGFAMNFGFMTSWVSTTNTLNIPVLLTAGSACWCWTMLYDTIYACQDIEDDRKIGIQSTAILFGSYIRPLLIACGCFFVLLFCGAGILNGQGLAFYVLSIGGLLLHLIMQWWTVDLEIPKSCWANFNSNGQLGWIIWLGLVVDYASVLVVHATSS
ncbi:4-hydroxybenzoate polyprenyl transferase [Lentinula detonsa]|uniref:4-hydroxybenzoate polyprenyltransferase, mitochondrial n=1 Tax=Lentinula detonsa TaxID=2804962 RepID=A0A9W8TUB7_9AGAR|nr:4-hydroxybenzoate polyprenyl transferase [Lentinula detonsa]KAJ3984241.1 4-hydroxybenzoate polyprenyl transferase [Lentinula detonsa]